MESKRSQRPERADRDQVLAREERGGGLGAREQLGRGRFRLRDPAQIEADDCLVDLDPLLG